LNLLPPNVKQSFEDNDVVTQAQILAYSQIREVEEVEMAKAMIPRL